jgi:hypothetical protein
MCSSNLSWKKSENSFQVNKLSVIKSLNKKFFTLALILLMFSSVSMPQVVYEQLYKDVYNYLRRLSQKDVIEFNDLIRPLPKKYILEKLLEAKNNPEKLTSLEKEELDFFIKDYHHEKWFLNGEVGDQKHLNFIDKDPAERWRFFSYDDSHFRINGNLILGVELSSID